METKKISQDQIKELLDRIIDIAEHACGMSLPKAMEYLRNEYRVQHLYELREDQFEDIMANYDDVWDEACQP